MISGLTVGMAQASEKPSDPWRDADALALAAAGGADQHRWPWMERDCVGPKLG